MGRSISLMWTSIREVRSRVDLPAEGARNTNSSSENGVAGSGFLGRDLQTHTAAMTRLLLMSRASTSRTRRTISSPNPPSVLSKGLC
jgi:hypothetical protein